MAFIGFLRAARGERLLGNKTVAESDPCPTRGAAEAWVTSMLASNVEAGKPVVESGVRKHEGKKARRPVETDTDVEREVAERQEADAKSRRRSRRRSANGSADHAPATRKNATK